MYNILKKYVLLEKCFEFMMNSMTPLLFTYQSVFSVQIKNCEPLVFGPELAIESVPGCSCLSWKFSSLNFPPYIDLPPVPL